MNNKINIGLYEYGVVGESLYHVLKHSKKLDAGVSEICLRQKDMKRSLAEDQFTYNKEDIIDNRNINLEIIPVSILFSYIINESKNFSKKMQLV